MKPVHQHIHIVSAIGLGLAASAISLFAADIKSNIPASGSKLAILSMEPNICAAEATEQNPRPFLFIGCGIE